MRLDKVFRAQYLPSGHLVFARAGSLYAAPFDEAQMKVTGGETALQFAVQMDCCCNRIAFWDVSAEGTHVYVPFDPAANETRLAWIDRAPNRQPLDLFQKILIRD